MIDWQAFLVALMALSAFGVGGWFVSLEKKDVSIVDSMWSVMFIIAAGCYLLFANDVSTRAIVVMALVSIWGLRLATYITWRNWGEEEDARYQAIRRNNSPGFEWKSLYIVFGLQAGLAWLISLPLLAAINGSNPLNVLDVAGVAVWLLGFFFESVGDLQLARFKADPDNEGKVMDRGLWRYTRHPNYFGDFCVWWGFYLIALAAGGWWTIIAPLLMSFLLLKVSGVAMLEKDISDRRPKYADYIERTNAFFPGPPKDAAKDKEGATA